ncbi:MAG: TlpA family protein disulfide reductase [Bacteroidales bacterium]|nr:TlpA family protein disulfide reductase [Bacteroidales bacterium]
MDFRLPDNETYMHNLSDFRGKFVYLGFFSTDSYPCKKDILLIKALAEKKPEFLKIILIFKEAGTARIKSFLKDIDTKNITILHSDDNGKVIEDYNVRAYPTYFLINPKGKLTLISAPGPAEDFEAAYFKIKQEWKIKQARNNKN